MFFLLLSACNFLFAQPPRVEKIAEWYQQGYYILSPDIGNTVTEIAFVRMLSGRDSSIDENSFLLGVALNYLPKESIKNRQFDPVISIFNFRNRLLSIIDYGWTPAFSPNDNKIAYAFQLNPLKNQDKLYAEAYKGNSIKIFKKSSGEIEEVAKPSGNYLLDPFFTDSTTLVYKTGNKANGPYGAAISLSEVNLINKKTKLIRPPAIKYRLNELVGEPYVFNKKIAYTVYSPVDSGTGMASEYQHLLLSGNDTIQNFGIRKFTNLHYKFVVNQQGNLYFLDDEHFWAEDTNYLAVYKNDRLIEKKPLLMSYKNAYLSPNGKYLLYFTPEMEYYIVNVKDFEQAKIEMPRKEPLAVAWDNKDSRVAIVQSHETLIGTDKLLIFDIK